MAKNRKFYSKVYLYYQNLFAYLRSKFGGIIFFGTLFVILALTIKKQDKPLSGKNALITH